jgi:hypothetical protein
MAEEKNSLVFKSSLKAKVVKASGEVEDKGVVATRLVTTVGVNALVDAFQNLFTLSNFKYHISGTDTAAEAIGDTEATITGTTPNPVTGSQTEGASANIYKTVATIPYVSTLAITSHGLINSGTKAASVLWDRSVFAAINVVNGDSIEFTYELTCNAGG